MKQNATKMNMSDLKCHNGDNKLWELIGTRRGIIFQELGIL